MFAGDKSLVVLFFLLLPSCVAAQSYFFRQYGPEDGLPTSNVYDIAQDHAGIIWMGTELGLTSFDGNDFQTYTMEDGLPNNTVAHIAIDSSDRVWLYTFSNTISYFENGQGKMLEDENELSIYRSSYLQAAEDGSVYIFQTRDDKASIQTPVFRVDRWGKKVAFHNLMGTNQSRIITWNDDFSIFCNRNYFILFNDTGAFDTLEVEHAQTVYNCIRFNDRILCVGQSNEWTRSFLICLDPVTGDQELFLSELQDSFPDFHINRVFTDREENLWILLRNGLLLVTFDEEGNPSYEYMLEGKKTTSFLQDGEGNYWISTEGDGVFLLISTSIKYLQTNQGLSGNTIRSLASAPNGEIFVGYTEGMVDRFSPDLSQKETIKISNERVVDLHYREDEIVAITDIGVYTIDEYGKVENEFLTDFPLKHANFLNDSMFLFSYAIFRKEGQKIYRLNASPIYRIYTSFQFNDSIVWLGTTRGIFKYDFRSEDYLGPLHPDIQADVRSIVQSDPSTYWIATLGHGVFRYSTEGAIQQFARAEGLPSPVCNDMILVGNTLWIATAEGLCRMDVTTLEIESFSTFHGLSGGQMIYLTQSGDHLMIAAEKGLHQIPLDLNATSDPPIFRIKEMQVHHEPVSLDENLMLAYQDNDIQFLLEGISFRSDGDLKYEYRLLGVHDEWIASSSPIINLAGLAPGSYTFQARVRGKSTDWSSIQTVQFEINSAWWQTSWFLVLVVLLGIGLIFLLSRSYYIRRERRSRRRRQLIESQLTALRAQMNPHFMFNALNSIQEFINLNDPRTANDYLASFATLIRKILEQSESDRVSVAQEMEILELYLSLEKLRLKGSLDYSITADSAIHTTQLFIPSMVIQPLVENAIKHGLFHKNGPKQVRVEFRLECPEFLRCTIEDNGIGRAQAAAIQEMSGKIRKSTGNKVTQQRLDLISKFTELPLSIQYDDLYGPDGKAAGTKVQVRLPVLSHQPAKSKLMP